MGFFDKLRQGLAKTKNAIVGRIDSIVKAFTIEVLDADGNWQIVAEENNNFQRHVRVPVNRQAYGIRLTPKATWGAENARVFSLDLI